jgi:chemotaxis protein MotA
LWQPSEFVIIFGAGIGAIIISSNKDSLKDGLKSFKNLFKGKPYSKKDYTELLVFFSTILKLIKSKGLLEIESHIDKPHESSLFALAPSLLHNHHALEFLCDYLRMMTMGVDNPHIIEDVLERELEALKHEFSGPGAFWGSFGESLPALGIVAAVLGVIHTMGSIAEPPEVLGHLIGAALVGTFSGILFSYGIFSPVGSFLVKYGECEFVFFECLKVAILSYLQGNSPTVCVEFIRKSVHDHERPSFKELEEAIANAPKP